MKRIHLLGFLSLSAVCLPLLTACSRSEAAPPPAPARDDLRMGSLGYGRGTYLTISGVRDMQGMVGSGQLRVDTVNGARIDPPVSIQIEDVSLVEGERVELKGYESGRFIGMPDEVARATGLPPTQAAWQFHSYFIATSIESGGAHRNGAPAPGPRP